MKEIQQGSVEIKEKEPAKDLSEWLFNDPTRSLVRSESKTWTGAKSHVSRLKDGLVTVSVGYGPTTEKADQDAWSNLPNKRR